MIFDNIKKWFDKDEAKEIIEELQDESPSIEPIIEEPVVEEPKTYSFM
jgi:hypothetical protein